jgi:hypothetical protein
MLKAKWHLYRQAKHSSNAIRVGGKLSGSITGAFWNTPVALTWLIE